MRIWEAIRQMVQNKQHVVFLSSPKGEYEGICLHYFDGAFRNPNGGYSWTLDQATMESNFEIKGRPIIKVKRLHLCYVQEQLYPVFLGEIPENGRQLTSRCECGKESEMGVDVET